MFSDVHYSLNQNKTQDPYIDLYLMVERLKLKYNYHTYLIQLTHFEFGDIYSFFFVSMNEKDKFMWESEKEDLKQGYQFVYAFNFDEPMCSEFGDITFRKGNMGGIIRTA